MENQEDGKGVLLSVLAGIGIGVIVGGIAGLLFAPKAGTEIRETVTKTLSDLAAKVSDLSQQATERVKTVMDTTASDAAKEAPSEETASEQA
jgi:gas vesicle protein